MGGISTHLSYQARIIAARPARRCDWMRLWHIHRHCRPEAPSCAEGTYWCRRSYYALKTMVVSFKRNCTDDGVTIDAQPFASPSHFSV